MSSGNNFPPQGIPPRPPQAPPSTPLAGSPASGGTPTPAPAHTALATSGSVGTGPRGTGPGPVGTLGTGPNQTPQPAPAPGYNAQRRDTRKKKSKLPLIISLAAALGVVLLVVAGVIVVNVVNKQQYGPDVVAQDYADAINAGDYAAANDIAALRIPQGAREELLDAKYFQASENKIVNMKITSTERRGDTAQIGMAYTVGGQEYTMNLHAEKDGKKGLFFDNWTLQGPQAQPVNLSVPTADVKVNGEDFTAQPGSAIYAVFPGSYTVESPDSKYVSGAKESGSYGFVSDNTQEPAELTLNAEVKDSFEKDVRDIVNDQIDKCIKSGKFKPDPCNFGVDPNTVSEGITLKEDVGDGNVKWKLEEKPEISAYFSPSFGEGSWSTTKPGKVSFTADSKELGITDAWSSEAFEFRMSGIVKIEGDKLKVEYL